eukprot:jgi/Hompol1/6671/HPOL_000128-RA
MGESRQELLAWLCDLTMLPIQKIEMCGTGAAHCVIMDSIYRDVPLSKVKFAAKHEYEYVANYKVLQAVFDKHKIENAIPVERLIKCKFQDNLEFLQWMKKYAYYPGGAYDAVARRKQFDATGGLARPAGTGSSLGIHKAPSPQVGMSAAQHPSSASGNVKKSMSNSSVNAISAAGPRKPSGPPRGSAAAAAGPLSVTAGNNGGVPASASDLQRAELVAEYQKMSNDMSQQVAELKITVEQVEREREFYFSKLREIEMYIQSRTESGIDDHLDEAFKEIQSIMYKTEEGFEIPVDGDDGQTY